MTYNPYSLEGKTILVTGASSGIGRATAIECSRLGANVILSGRNAVRLEETLTLLESSNIHKYIIADLSSEAGIKSLVGSVSALDGCVNNAGINKILPIQFISQEAISEVFSVDCFAPMLLTKALVRAKCFNKNASIVYMLSIAGNFNILPGNSLYGSAKTALSAFIKYSALELAGKKIRCNAVSPGMVNTELIKSLPVSEIDMQKDMSLYPLKRYGEPEEIAHAIIYFLSDASSWVTGSNLVIDGGRSLK